MNELLIQRSMLNVEEKAALHKAVVELLVGVAERHLCGTRAVAVTLDCDLLTDEDEEEIGSQVAEILRGDQRIISVDRLVNMGDHNATQEFYPRKEVNPRKR